MPDQQYCLRWSYHQPNFISAFSSLLREESLVDVTLAAEEKYIQAHKIVLSACSTYFYNLFKANPCQHPIVILKDVSYDDLKSVVDFIYNGEVNVSHEHLQTVLRIAVQLGIKGLADMPVDSCEPAKSHEDLDRSNSATDAKRRKRSTRFSLAALKTTTKIMKTEEVTECDELADYIVQDEHSYDFSSTTNNDHQVSKSEPVSPSVSNVSSEVPERMKRRSKSLVRQDKVFENEDSTQEKDLHIVLPGSKNILSRHVSDPTHLNMSKLNNSSETKQSTTLLKDALLKKQISDSLVILPTDHQRTATSPLDHSSFILTSRHKSNHCPLLRPGPALGCNYCWNTIDKQGRILRRKTRYHCPECQTNLCIVPCFQEYHDDKKSAGACKGVLMDNVEDSSDAVSKIKSEHKSPNLVF